MLIVAASMWRCSLMIMALLSLRPLALHELREVRGAPMCEPRAATLLSAAKGTLAGYSVSAS